MHWKGGGSLETRNPSILESFLSTLEVVSSSEKEGRDRRREQLIPSVCYFLFPASLSDLLPFRLLSLGDSRHRPLLVLFLILCALACDLKLWYDLHGQ